MGIKNIEDLRPHEGNANLGTLRGAFQLEESLRNDGAGRGVTVDKNGVVIGGNHVVEIAAELGFEVKVVHSSGEKVIAGRRQDLDLREERARRMAYADNRISEVNRRWDVAKILSDYQQGFDFGPMFTTDELTDMAKKLAADLDKGGEGAGEPATIARRKTISIRVPPETNNLYHTLIDAMPGGDEDEKFISLVRRAQ